jgi:hypothetical protein
LQMDGFRATVTSFLVLKRREVRLKSHPSRSIESAHIEQTILANISPEVSVSYAPYLFEGQQLGILTIRDPRDRPYAAVREIKVNNTVLLRENEMLIRKGSHRCPMNRADLELIYNEKLHVDKLDRKVVVSFPDDTKEL